MSKIICCCADAKDRCQETCSKGMALKPTSCYAIPQWPRAFGLFAQHTKEMMDKLKGMNKS